MSARAFDVAVIGAGAAGCVVAGRLAERTDRSVLLLEAGPDLRARSPAGLRDGWSLPGGDDWPDWGFESEPTNGGAPAKLRRGRLVGGTGWLTRFAVRGAAADFDAWARLGNPGWAFEDVLPAFRRLESDAEFARDAWHGADGPIPISRYPELERSGIHGAAIRALEVAGFPTVADHNAPTAVGAGPMPMSTRGGERVTTADAYLTPAATQPNLVVRAEAPVARLILERGRARGVELVGGERIDAGWVIVAAGTYGSPPILMRSGIGPAEHLREHGIPVAVDLRGVGTNLADHPAVDLDSGWRGPATTGPVLHTIATFRSSGSPEGAAPDLMFWVQDPVGDEPRFYLDPILLKPRSRGTVRLRSADPTAAPRITLPALDEPADVERLMDAYLRGLELANATAIRTFGGEPPPSAPRSRAELRARVLDNAYSIPHVVGTCAMGPSPADGAVVDALGRVHGVEQLSVIDASVIPDAPSGFPHVITIMVAEHLTEKLADAF